MPQLVWEPVDVLSVLEVAPEIAEYETSHRYVIEQAGVKLQVTIWQYDSDVEILLWVDSLPEPVLRYNLLGCPGIRVVEGKRGSFLEFAAANSFTGRYDGYSPMPYGLRLWIKPQILLEPFVYHP
ncbi:MAG: Ypar14, superfamily integron cassette [Bacillota bacterium]